MPYRKILSLLVAILVVCGCLLKGQFRQPDLSEEEKPLSQIELPLRTITGNAYMDGGSVYLEIVDRKSVKHEFVAPITGGVGGTFPTIVSGTIDPRSSTGVVLKDTRRAKAVLLELISKYRKPTDIGIVNVKYALLGTEPGTFDELPAWIANDWWPE